MSHISPLQRLSTQRSSSPSRTPAQPPELPPDQFQRAESHSSGGWSLGKTALVVLGAGAALTGCTQAPPVQPIQATTPLPLENPELMILSEAVPRIDLHRSTSTDISTDMDGNVTTSESDDPYKEVGTHLGSGIFLDTNDNLVFVPQLAFGQEVGLTQFQRATLGREDSRWFSPPTLTREADGSVTLTRSSVDRIHGQEGSLTQISGRRERREAVRTPGGVELREWNRTRFEIRQNGNQLEVYRSGTKTHTLTRQDGTIHLQRYNQRPYVITQDGPNITVDQGYRKPQVITTSADGFQVQQVRDYTVTFTEGSITSSYSGHTPIYFRPAR